MEALKLGGGARGSTGTAGAEKAPYLVVDGFLDSPQLMIDSLTDSQKFSADATYYPGIRQRASREYSRFLVGALQKKLLSHFDVDISRIRSVESYFSIITREPDKLDFMQVIPHFDFPLKRGLASILYLCDSSKGGTSLYRHKRTGFERIDQERFSLYKDTLEKEFNSSSEALDGYINETNNFFEKIHSFDAKFNRLVMYRGSSLHSGDISADYDFDPSPRTGRLTLTSFIHVNE